MLEPNNRLVELFLVESRSELGPPPFPGTMVGGGVKTHRPPRLVPLAGAGNSGMPRVLRTGETRTTPLPFLEGAAVAVEIDDERSCPALVWPPVVFEGVDEEKQTRRD